ncbi:MAG: hypothetical protein ACKO85_20925, partial [Isosphaeraceae bacterium]
MRNRSIISRFLVRARGPILRVHSSRKTRFVRRLSLLLEPCEPRQLLTLPPTLTIPLVPELDQFGDQILIVQGFDLPERSALGIFDTGASAVTFAATDREVFAGIEAGPIPIKVPGGAAAGGIGGEIVGDVSEPGIIYSDGMHAFDLSFDDFGFPQFNITLSPSAIETPGIQAFVGTDSSPLLPTITGTPALQPSPKYPNGAAARISMQGAKIDFSDIFPDLIIPFPDLTYTVPGSTIEIDPNDTTVYEPLTLPLIPFGGDQILDEVLQPHLLTRPEILWQEIRSKWTLEAMRVEIGETDDHLALREPSIVAGDLDLARLWILKDRELASNPVAWLDDLHKRPETA